MRCFFFLVKHTIIQKQIINGDNTTIIKNTNKREKKHYTDTAAATTRLLLFFFFRNNRKKKGSESCCFEFCFSFYAVWVRNERFLLQIWTIKERKTKNNIFRVSRNFFIRDNNTEKFSWCSLRIFCDRGNSSSLVSIELEYSCVLMNGPTNFWRPRFLFWLRIFSKKDILDGFR